MQSNSGRFQPQLPEIVRIKRKRNQDSLDALILDNSRNRSKKLKPNSHISTTESHELHIFKLQRTEDQIPNTSSSSTSSASNETNSNASSAKEAFLPLLQELNESRTKFSIPKQTQNNATEEKLPQQFTDMLNDMLDLSTATNTKEEEGEPLKRRKRKTPLSAGTTVSATTSATTSSTATSSDLDYVYDVYYRDQTMTDTTVDTSSAKIAYLHFQEDIDAGLVNVNDDSSDDELRGDEDDEDSNAEDFYKNDYPEGEEEDEEEEEILDSEELEEQGEDHGERDEDYGDFENEMWDAEEQQQEYHSNEQEFDNLYDQYYGNTATAPVDFISEQLRAELESSDEDDYDYEDNERLSSQAQTEAAQFKRNHFFPGDEEDPMAIHRDRIFGDLERMINERK